jgi:hypothetical protein
MIICFITLTIHAEREKEEDYLLKFHKWRATREQSIVVTNVFVSEAERIYVLMESRRALKMNR